MSCASGMHVLKGAWTRFCTDFPGLLQMPLIWACISFWWPGVYSIIMLYLNSCRASTCAQNTMLCCSTEVSECNLYLLSCQMQYINVLISVHKVAATDIWAVWPPCLVCLDFKIYNESRCKGGNQHPASHQHFCNTFLSAGMYVWSLNECKEWAFEAALHPTFKGHCAKSCHRQGFAAALQPFGLTYHNISKCTTVCITGHLHYKWMTAWALQALGQGRQLRNLCQIQRKGGGCITVKTLSLSPDVIDNAAFHNRIAIRLGVCGCVMLLSGIKAFNVMLCMTHPATIQASIAYSLSLSLETCWQKILTFLRQIKLWSWYCTPGNLPAQNWLGDCIRQSSALWSV